MEKNIRCPSCKANAFHIDRNDDGSYTIKCMTKQACERKVKFNEDILIDLT